MTSYSTYMVGHIRLVDGGLSTDDELREEQFEQVVNCLLAGTIRALLDQVRDISDPEELNGGIYAEQWHSEDEGWEMAAVVDDELPQLRTFVEGFARDMLPDILTLSAFIAWGEQTRGQVWHGNSGMGMYRVGYLLGMEGSGNGIGFTDYAYPIVGGIPERLSDWLDTNGAGGGNPWEGAWIDGTEEPCLLHLK